MQQLQSALGIFALLGIAWIISEDRRAVSWRQAAIGLAVTFATAVLLLKVPGVTAAFAAINDAVGAIAAASRAGTSFVFGYLGGGTLPLRAQGAGRRIRARIAGAADRAGDERADHAAVLLAHSAADRARLLLAARAHPRRRRRGRALDRRQYLPRHGRGAAVHPALSGEPHAQRAVHGDDRRHGGHRRHRAGALRELARADHPRRRRPFRDRLGARRAGRDPDQPDHGARPSGQHTGGKLGEAEPIASSTMDAIVQGHRRRSRAAAQHLRHADRAGRAGASRQRHARPPPRRRRRADHAAAHARDRDGAGLLADGHSLEPGARPPAA